MTTEVNELTPSVYELSLDDNPEPRPTWKINGEELELAMFDDYSVPEVRNFNRMWKQIQTWDNMDSLTESQGKEYVRYLDELVRKALPRISDDIIQHPKFDRTKKISVVLSFFLEDQRRVEQSVKLIADSAKVNPTAPFRALSQDSPDSTVDLLENT